VTPSGSMSLQCVSAVIHTGLPRSCRRSISCDRADIHRCKAYAGKPWPISDSYPPVLRHHGRRLVFGSTTPAGPAERTAVGNQRGEHLSRLAEYDHDAEPVKAALAAAGIDTRDFGRFANRPVPGVIEPAHFDAARAMPILLEWLPRVGNEKLRETMVRHLAIKDATADPGRRQDPDRWHIRSQHCASGHVGAAPPVRQRRRTPAPPAIAPAPRPANPQGGQPATTPHRQTARTEHLTRQHDRRHQWS
jgi:hypothetical protein